METKKKITVIGAGNGGMAMAYSLGQMGHDVSFMIPLIFRFRLMRFMKKGELRLFLNYMNVPC